MELKERIARTLYTAKEDFDPVDYNYEKDEQDIQAEAVMPIIEDVIEEEKKTLFSNMSNYFTRKGFYTALGCLNEYVRREEGINLEGK